MLRFSSGVPLAVLAAILFGASTPLAKVLLADISPWMLAGLLYLGSGAGLFLYRIIRCLPTPNLTANERLWFAGAILAGGVVAPVLLMLGLNQMPASGASLLLNAEGVLTAVIAWLIFRENADRRIVFGMLAIVVGALILCWPAGRVEFGDWWPSLAILGACGGWAIDNNLTRKVSLTDATWIAASKGLVAGAVNLTIATVLGDSWPSLTTLTGSLILGFCSYGLSLSLFVLSLRYLGTARTGAYFSIAPFFGAVLAILFLEESPTTRFYLAAVFMGFGLWLHVTEKHEHEHTHEEIEHEHEHEHDDHHAHAHDETAPFAKRHSHRHRHKRLTHSHAHYPDAHHRHDFLVPTDGALT